jgi:hypothetical protein
MMIKMMPMGDFFTEQAKYALKFNCLELTDSELGLLLGLIIINPCK